MKYSITNDTITVVINGDVQTIHAGMTMFGPVREALFQGDFSRVSDLITPAKAINTWSKGDFKVVNGAIQYKGEQIPGNLDRRILQMVSEGSDPAVLTNFWTKLQQNPSRRSVEQLFTFLVHEGIPLTPEGDILAYKSVQSDFRDWHSGQHTNVVGTVNEMPRNRISDDPNEACHYGFHVGALRYAQEFHAGDSQKLVICKVNPADVVCVPYDCEAQKVRVCRYEVVGLFGAQLPSTVFVEDADERSCAVDEDCDELEDDDYSYDDEDEDDCDDDDCDSQEDDCDYLDEDDYDYIDADDVDEDEEEEDEEEQDELEAMTLEDLRSYACHQMKIVGASRIPGGKAALIERIRQVRGY